LQRNIIYHALNVVKAEAKRRSRWFTEIPFVIPLGGWIPIFIGMEWQKESAY
jgi:hypothetical protein